MIQNTGKSACHTLLSSTVLLHGSIYPTINMDNSPTGPGFVSMSPLSNRRRTNTNTTSLPKSGRRLRCRLDGVWQTLKWDEVFNGKLLTMLFWRTIIGSTLLREDKTTWTRGLWQIVMSCRWTSHWSAGVMWYVVANCACSAVSCTIGSIKMHTAMTRAFSGVTWHSSQWWYMNCCCFW